MPLDGNIQKNALPEGPRLLTEEEAKCVAAYIEKGTYTAVARAAGLSGGKRVLSSRGRAIMERPHMQRALHEHKLLLAVGLDVTRERIEQEVARIGFSSITNYVYWDEDEVALIPSDEVSTDAARAVQSLEVKETKFFDLDGNHRRTVTTGKIKTHPKLPALKLAAELLGLYSGGGQGAEAPIRTLIFEPPKAIGAAEGAEDVQYVEVQRADAELVPRAAEANPLLPRMRDV